MKFVLFVFLVLLTFQPVFASDSESTDIDLQRKKGDRAIRIAWPSSGYSSLSFGYRTYRSENSAWEIPFRFGVYYNHSGIERNDRAISYSTGLEYLQYFKSVSKTQFFYKLGCTISNRHSLDKRPKIDDRNGYSYPVKITGNSYSVSARFL